MLSIYKDLSQCTKILNVHHFPFLSFILILLHLDVTFYVMSLLMITGGIIPMCRTSFLIALWLRFILFVCFRLVTRFRMSLNLAFSVFSIFTFKIFIFNMIFEYLFHFFNLFFKEKLF